MPFHWYRPLTQIQEQTLVFVPKIIAVFSSLLIFLPFMSDALGGYMSPHRGADRDGGMNEVRARIRGASRALWLTSPAMDLLIPEIAAAFLLTFARVGTLVMLLPGVGEQSLNSRARLSFALLLTLVMFPATQGSLPMGEGGPQLIHVASGGNSRRPDAGSRHASGDGRLADCGDR